MNRKDYVAPSVEVVEMQIQGSLLAGSDQNASIENAGLNNFEEWE